MDSTTVERISMLAYFSFYMCCGGLKCPKGLIGSCDAICALPLPNIQTSVFVCCQNTILLNLCSSALFPPVWQDTVHDAWAVQLSAAALRSQLGLSHASRSLQSTQDCLDSYSLEQFLVDLLCEPLGYIFWLYYFPTFRCKCCFSSYFTLLRVFLNWQSWLLNTQWQYIRVLTEIIVHLFFIFVFENNTNLYILVWIWKLFSISFKYDVNVLYSYKVDKLELWHTCSRQTAVSGIEE